MLLVINRPNARGSVAEVIFGALILGLHLSIANEFVSSKMFDKCDGFNIVIFFVFGW